MFFTIIKPVHFLFFEHIIFEAEKAIHDSHYLVTTNKYSNQIYVIKPSDHKKTGLYQGSDNRCEGDRSYDLIRLLQQSQSIHYCNKSVLGIFPDLNMIYSVLRLLISFREAPWYSYKFTTCGIFV